MPPAKPKFGATEDSRSDVSTVRERQIAAAAHARKSKANGAVAQNNGTGNSLKDLALASADASNSHSSSAQSHGVSRPLAPNPHTCQADHEEMAWNTAPLSLLNSYRVAHNLSTPAAFTTPLNQALLTNPGIGRQSPTMARKRDKRRVSKEQLAVAVRRSFKDQAVSEIDVVCEFVYRVRNRHKAFRLRSAPGIVKK